MFKKSSLIIQVAAVAGLIAALGIFVTGWTGYQHQKLQALEDAVSQAYSLNQGYFEMLNTLMLTGNMDERNRVVKHKINTMPNVVEARVIRGEPVNGQFGPGFDDEQPLDEWDARALRGEDIIEIAEQNGQRILTMVRPWKPVKDYNGVNCFNCHHVPEGSVNGAIRIGYSLAESDQAIDNALKKDLFISAITAGISSLVIFMFMIIRMKRPLKEAEEIATRIANGEFNFDIHVHKQDEAGGVLIALEKMRQALIQADDDKARRAAEVA
ncbi:MAG: methyl-accepting chemotaxis protein, partial [Zetaproteobacteria bacterium]|nr:methyl-accepting chemotaxis protein [Zetaproteobacteria bacterium]